MISPHGQLRVYVSTRPVDFRKGIDGLALAVQEVIGLDPFSGAAFVFRAKRADRIKILIWDRTGMVLVHKRLESGKFVWPRSPMSLGPLAFHRLARTASCGSRRRSSPRFSKGSTGGSSARRRRAARSSRADLRPGDPPARSAWSLAWRRALIRKMIHAALAEENARLRARLAETEAALADAQESQRRLESIVSELRREKFGAKSEKLDPDQFNLPLEDVEVAQGVLEAAQERARQALKGGTDQDCPPKRNRGHLPKHLPRIERVIEPETTSCPCGCGCGEMAKIGEDVSERLDIVPAQLRVLVTRRPRYACRRCSGTVVQAHAPEHVVPGGLPTEALIAQVIVSKFGDHLPFYRQAGIYKRQGIALDRATLGNWVGRACFHLRPIVEHMRERPEGSRSGLHGTRPGRRCSTPGARERSTASSGRSSRTTAATAAPVHPS